MSKANEVLQPSMVGDVHQDMTKPLAHYFVHSSHKTYLSGGQVADPPSEEMLARTLLQGCRYIELDVQDGPTGEPIVQYCHTLSGSLSLHECLAVIEQHAFTISGARPAAVRTSAALSPTGSCSLPTGPWRARGAPRIRTLPPSLPTRPSVHRLGLQSRLTRRDALDSLPRLLSAYPVIIGLSVELSAAQQRVLTTTIHEVFGPTLFARPPAAAAAAEGGGAAAEPLQLPSPEHLRHRVLLLERAPDGALAGVGDAKSEDSIGASEGSPSEGRHSERAKGGAQSFNSRSGSTEPVRFQPGRAAAAPTPNELVPLVPELAALFAIRASDKEEPPDETATGQPPAWHTTTLSEAQAAQAIAGGVQPLLLHNMQGLTHVAPKPTRDAKTNLHAPSYWDAGCQLVALSGARHDAQMQIQQGKFLINGGCGYVLKPRRMRSATEAARHPANAPPRKLVKLQIKLICAQHLPKLGQRRVEPEGWHIGGCPLLVPHECSNGAVVSPYVVFEAVGGPFAAAGDDLDECAHGDAWASKTVAQNGLSPQWMQTVEIGVADPDLAVLRCSVWDAGPTAASEPKFLCYASLPVAAIRAGYRNVPMRDEHGCRIAFCKLLWHVRLANTHVPPSVTAQAEHHRRSGADGSDVPQKPYQKLKHRAVTAPPGTMDDAGDDDLPSPQHRHRHSSGDKKFIAA